MIKEGETASFQASLGKLGDVYVNDAFGTAHRAHSSMVGMAGKMPCVAGLLVQKELNAFSQVLDPSKREAPLTAIVGGAKISDKILVIENPLDQSDRVMCIGGMAYTFMKVVHNMPIGISLFDKKGAELVPKLMAKAKAKGCEIVLPCDWKCGKEFKNDQETIIVTDKEGIPDGWEGMDCGPKSMALFREKILSSKTVIWNGPAGVFEFDNFSHGTKAVLEAVAETTAKGNKGIIGGGDSATAAAKFDMEDKVTFVSTGGGASLELLEGKVLPGIAALDSYKPPVKAVEASGDFKVADMSLADFGRKEYDLAEYEMPGLMSAREEFGPAQPLAGVKIMGSLHMTIQTGVLAETLQHLGGDIRWCSCNIFSTQDHAAAAIVRAGTANVFAWKGETLEEYWWCTDKAISWPDGEGMDQIVDDGGDMTLLLHEGTKFELATIKASIQKDKTRFQRMVDRMVGVSEETTTGVHRLIQMADKGELLFPAINVNDCVTKSKFDNVYGCRHSLPDSIMRATDVMLGGKRALICGFGDVGKGCAHAMRGCGARVMVTEIDPICALQACMEGFQVVKMESVVGEADIFVTTTGNFKIIKLDHMKAMKNNAIVGNIGHFDNEIEMELLEKFPGIKVENIKPQVDRFVFPDGHGVIILASGRLCNLGFATGHPSFVMSCSFTNQVLAQLDILKNWKETKAYKNQVYLLPKELDEKVARLHLPALGAEMTALSQEQADYIGVKVGGPYKPDTYRY